MARWRSRFPSPFVRNGCVPIAWAAAAGLDAEGARLLADYAKGIPSSRGAWAYPKAPGVLNGYDPQPRAPLCLPSYGAFTSTAVEIAAWAKLAGVTVARTIEPEGTVGYRKMWYEQRPQMVLCRPTVAQFAKAHPTGRWVICVARHAMNVIDGVVYNGSPRSRVEQAIEVVI